MAPSCLPGRSPHSLVSHRGSSKNKPQNTFFICICCYSPTHTLRLSQSALFEFLKCGSFLPAHHKPSLMPFPPLGKAPSRLPTLYPLHHHQLELKSCLHTPNSASLMRTSELPRCLSSIPAPNCYFNLICVILTTLTICYLTVV